MFVLKPWWGLALIGWLNTNWWEQVIVECVLHAALSKDLTISLCSLLRVYRLQGNNLDQLCLAFKRQWRQTESICPKSHRFSYCPLLILNLIFLRTNICLSYFCTFYIFYTFIVALCSSRNVLNCRQDILGQFSTLSGRCELCWNCLARGVTGSGV